MSEPSSPSSSLPTGVMVGIAVIVAALAAMFIFGGGGSVKTPGPVNPGGAGPANPPAGGGAPAPAGGGGRMDTFIPDAEKTEISPILKAVAAWPAADSLTPAAAADTPPAVPDVNNLRILVGSLLAPDLRPARFDDALALDEAGALHIKLGRTGGKDRCEGLASCYRVKGMVTFSFSLTFPDATGPVTLDALAQRARSVVDPELAAEIAKPDFAPQPSPLMNGPEGIAAVCMLDRQGFGMIHPYLYLHAGPKTLVGVFQQIPDNKDPLKYNPK